MFENLLHIRKDKIRQVFFLNCRKEPKPISAIKLKTKYTTLSEQFQNPMDFNLYKNQPV